MSLTAILLRESYRQGSKLCKRIVGKLSGWPMEHIDGLRGVLKGGTVIPAEQKAFTTTEGEP